MTTTTTTTINRRIVTCSCGCGARTTDPTGNGWHKVERADRGGRAAYVCPACAAGMGDKTYSTDNNKTRGMRGVGGDFTYSVEFEVHSVDAALRSEMQGYDWLPTQDCTTDVEFKSPIFQNLKPLPKKLRTIETLLNNGKGRITDADGTHMHVGHADYINANSMWYIRDYYMLLFMPLCRAMQANPEKTERLYGRYFTGYACTIDEYTYATDHCNFINVAHSDTIEFRLCKFRSAKQYMKLFKLHKAMVSAIINNFVMYIGTGVSLTHKANITAGKLVKLYTKAIANM